MSVTVEPLDRLCCYPASLSTTTLQQDILKAAAKAYGATGLMRDIKASVDQAAAECPDLVLFNLFALCVSVPACRLVLEEFNEWHPRTLRFIDRARKEFSDLIRTVCIPSDARADASGGGAIHDPVDFTAHLRLLYFSV